MIWSFRRILTLLERGERETAEKELMVYLDDAERELLTSTPSPAHQPCLHASAMSVADESRSPAT